jgi:DNA-directed RNA polymerase sigma subunit (sigma70/sigma32)
VESPVAIYESQLREITDVCADPWFAEQLAVFRAGDEMAWRRISGSCLRRVLDIAKRKWQPRCPLELLDLVQEGNNVLVRTIKRFEGGTAAEFLSELTKQVEGRLTLVVEHPDLLR